MSLENHRGDAFNFYRQNISPSGTQVLWNISSLWRLQWRVKSFHLFCKYPKHDWPAMFIRKDYENMAKPSRKWDESNKTADTKKTSLASVFTEIETRSKKWTEMLFLFKYVKKYPCVARKFNNLKLDLIH